MTGKLACACVLPVSSFLKENCDVTTKEIHFRATSWHYTTLRACRCVPGCLEAFFEVNSIKQDHKAQSQDACR
jgi:hypothetical protein